MSIFNSIVKSANAQGTAINVDRPSYAPDNLGSIIGSVVNATIVIGALAAFMYLVLGGFQWITAGGDPKKTEEAQKKITNAVIGLVIIVAAWAIMNVVTQFLLGTNLENLDFGSIGAQG